jgi:hypothetical protein
MCRYLKSVGEQTVSVTEGEAISSDAIAISAVSEAFIVRLLEVGLRETLSGREGAH